MAGPRGNQTVWKFDRRDERHFHAPPLTDTPYDDTSVISAQVSAVCANNVACKATGLTVGNCCPTDDGTMLGCCPPTTAPKRRLR